MAKGVCKHRNNSDRIKRYGYSGGFSLSHEITPETQFPGGDHETCGSPESNELPPKQACAAGNGLLVSYKALQRLYVVEME